MELKDKTFIVAGASSGIGAAAVRLLASKGANMVIGSRRRPELDRLVEQVTQAKGSAVCLPGDVSNEAYAEALARCAQENFGGIDGALQRCAKEPRAFARRGRSSADLRQIRQGRDQVSKRVAVRNRGESSGW